MLSNDEIRLMCAWCVHDAIRCISHRFCKIVCCIHSFAYCIWIEISFLKNLHYWNWFIYYECIEYFVILWYITSVIQLQRHASYMHRSWRDVQFIECSSFQNGIFYLSLLCDFFLDVECQSQYWHIIYFQSIQSPRLHSYFRLGFFFLFQNYLPIYTVWIFSTNNEIFRAHSFIVQIYI